MSLRSVLGSRVKKSSRGSGPSSSLSSWPRTKPARSGPSPKHTPHDDYFHDEQLPDCGLVRALDDPTLRDVPQAMMHARQRMFDPVPGDGVPGMGSTGVSMVLRYRAALPPVVTTAHVQALLRTAGPTAVEREKAELLRAGTLRRIVVLRRGGASEALILASDIEALVRAASVDGGPLDRPTTDAFLSFLTANPAATRVPRVVESPSSSVSLSRRQTDALVRAGFLTSQHTGHDAGAVTGSISRPEDRYSLMSLEAVSRAASGSAAAVGGTDALHASGGSGAGRGGPAVDLVTGTGDLSLAVPGHGTYLKLVASALDHLAAQLRQLSPQFGEAPEASLRDKWEGGVAGSREAARAKRARGQFAGVLPGRTKKWKDFHGLAFDWVLHEAVGTGLVEVFETGSVGRGVRLV